MFLGLDGTQWTAVGVFVAVGIPIVVGIIVATLRFAERPKLGISYTGFNAASSFEGPFQCVMRLPIENAGIRAASNVQVLITEYNRSSAKYCVAPNIVLPIPLRWTDTNTSHHPSIPSRSSRIVVLGELKSKPASRPPERGEVMFTMPSLYFGHGDLEFGALPLGSLDLKVAISCNESKTVCLGLRIVFRRAGVKEGQIVKVEKF